MSSGRRLALQLAALGAYLWGALAYGFVCDDAYISFRYARNWAKGHGFRYNLGDAVPVEGYSNFLWTVLAGLCERAGLDPALVMPSVSLVCGAVLLLYVAWTLRVRLQLSDVAAGLATLALAAFPPFFVWATSGLATMAQALLMFALFERLVWGDGAWFAAGVAGALLALIRTEGVAWAAVIAGVAWGAGGSKGEGRRAGLDSARALALALVAFAPFLAWREATYHSLVSNTALAKVDPGPDVALRGLLYVASNTLVFLSPLAGWAGLVVGLRRDRAVGLAVAALALGVPAYAVVVGGDYMAFGRLLVPGAAFWALGLGWGLDALGGRRAWGAGLLAVAVGVLPAFGLHAVPEGVRELFQFRLGRDEAISERLHWQKMDENTRRWRRLGQYLATSGEGPVVAEAIGAIGYFSGRPILDRHGLVSPDVARLPSVGSALQRTPGHDKAVGREFFAGQHPDVLEARCVTGRHLEQGARKAVERIGPTEAERQDNVVDVVRLPDVPGEPSAAAVVLRRAREGEDVAGSWASLEGRIEALR